MIMAIFGPNMVILYSNNAFNILVGFSLLHFGTIKSRFHYLRGPNLKFDDFFLKRRKSHFDESVFLGLIICVDDCCPENSGKFINDNITDNKVLTLFNKKNFLKCCIRQCINY